MNNLAIVLVTFFATTLLYYLVAYGLYLRTMGIVKLLHTGMLSLAIASKTEVDKLNQEIKDINEKIKKEL